MFRQQIDMIISNHTSMLLFLIPPEVVSYWMRTTGCCGINWLCVVLLGLYIYANHLLMTWMMDHKICPMWNIMTNFLGEKRIIDDLMLLGLYPIWHLLPSMSLYLNPIHKA